jgi:hypothetical protein
MKIQRYIHSTLIFQDIPSESELQEEVDQWADENEAPVKVTPNRLNFYGAVPGK